MCLKISFQTKYLVIRHSSIGVKHENSIALSYRRSLIASGSRKNKQQIKGETYHNFELVHSMKSVFIDYAISPNQCQR